MIHVLRSYNEEVVISRDAVFDEHFMLQRKKEDALVDGSSIVEVDIDRVSLTERADNPTTVEKLQIPHVIYKSL
nr:hypothetical protein Itr_chr14CG17110 [Ipomoea trifida]